MINMVHYTQFSTFRLHELIKLGIWLPSQGLENKGNYSKFKSSMSNQNLPKLWRLEQRAGMLSLLGISNIETQTQKKIYCVVCWACSSIMISKIYSLSINVDIHSFIDFLSTDPPAHPLRLRQFDIVQRGKKQT